MTAVSGSLESIIDRLVLIQGAIPSIKTAFKEPPDALQTAQLPAFVNRPKLRQRVAAQFGTDALIMNQTIEMALYLRQVGLGLTSQPIGESLWALIESVEDALGTNSRLTVDGQATVDALADAFYNGCAGYEVRSYPEGSDTFYVTLVFQMTVQTARIIAPLP